MAVYREGFYIVRKLEKEVRQIWPDAADYGVLVKVGDENWNAVKQLVERYGVKGTKELNVYSGGSFQCKTVTQNVMLMDEWAVSDEKKSVKEATEIYRVSYNTVKNMKGYDGLITIDRIK